MNRARHAFLDELAERFASHGAEPYGESVSQAEHALQCATLAERAGCSDALVIAALLHDIGHLYENPDEIEARDLRHEEVGANLLRELLPESVWQPVRLHVAAKRYLCAVDAAYHAGLSPASRHSLALQGGPFDERGASAFLSAPYAQDAITLRRLDDLGKDPAMRTPELAHFFPLLERLLRIDGHQTRLRSAG
ncbi:MULTISPECIES: phosphonate degradation HD-domain oxygenase [Pseudomonas]|jgi:phosphonate degradation associated HDIG domain protein|uniref:phosphonate degradation HD-domain oxygenase n=1 Tax=Pseudomonas TaxID=286 RepID=UPI0007188F2E|nr:MULTISPECIES: phosphonate degradation HD-domain oxygenase [Pseudomonas]KSW27181.1 phosphohydrolase [Pseudomonas sp. ADP]KRV74340.1 phosphohydrolase [Pseudomonas citronellolis]KRW78404.1 phosphohydrolase [Pseudomonas citronellolis]OBP09879.1 phosphohydrolase [Pseudomonas sp. EGD-AKN5]QOF83841.1 HD domain-containing protein [Pseudomonas sp. ADPe]